MTRDTGSPLTSSASGFFLNGSDLVGLLRGLRGLVHVPREAPSQEVAAAIVVLCSSSCYVQVESPAKGAADEVLEEKRVGRWDQGLMVCSSMS